MPKKVAMVQPPPIVGTEHAASTKHAASLEEILQRMGNDRAYVVLKSSTNSWLVLFEGDHEPTLIKP